MSPWLGSYLSYINLVETPSNHSQGCEEALKRGVPWSELREAKAFIWFTQCFHLLEKGWMEGWSSLCSENP